MNHQPLIVKISIGEIKIEVSLDAVFVVNQENAIKCIESTLNQYVKTLQNLKNES